MGSWPRLTGRQEPEFESRHPGDESEGDRCAEFGYNLAKTYGVKTRCMPWQWSSVRGILSLLPANAYGERVWTHRDVCIEATRQQGKTLIVVLLILFHLFVAPAFGRARPVKIVYTAQRWSTAKDVYTRVTKVISRVPYLKQQLKRPPSTRDNHGFIEVVVERGKDGADDITATAEFAPRSQEFGRGVTELDILFLDEAYDIDPGIENDLTGAQSASDNPQTIYLSTAPVFAKHPKCHSLADMHRLGHARAPGLFYRLFAAPRHLSREDPATWRLAQPSFDVATNEREIGSKLQKARGFLKRSIFEADYLGWGDYPPPEVEGDTEISAEKWTGMGIKARGGTVPTLSGKPAVVIEREGSGPWVIVAAWRTSGGPVLIEVGYCEVASVATVVARVGTLVAAWDPCALMVRSGSAAAELLPDLETAGFEVTMANRTEVAQACGGFLNGARDREFVHSDQVEMDGAVSAAVKHDLPAGGFIWELVDEMSYPALMGASLAHWALTKFGVIKGPAPKPAFDRGDATPARNGTADRWSAPDSQFDPMTANF